ncbi:hypothetical protein D3C84_1130610 [compost metagenome]
MLLAKATQDRQAINPRQLPIGDYQVVGILRQQIQSLFAVATSVHPSIAAHTRQHLFKQLAGRRIGLGDQHAGYSG